MKAALKRKKKSKGKPEKKLAVIIIIRWMGIVLLAAMLVSIVTVVAFRYINPPVTPLIISRSIDGIKNRGKMTWVSYENISQHMVNAVVASEDNRFVEHRGFDFAEVRKAYEQHRKGRRLRGASTITQQTCKNVFLWDGRSYIRKGLEVWFTVWVELLWSKQRIMEVYLNVIEMGGGIYGIEVAAQAYYCKPASRLLPEEAAMIAAILPSPLKRDPMKPTAYMQKRQLQILDLMNKIGMVKL
ncbi:MAG: monofunctional biosynthetic peptidoglycan transglycosylase [Bacteroidales bacterium]|jgi:monofunctional biosynthetic peptidoglycan transglycosylase|nr:monofunctional biosynthetic peptidoglycan transglycosylase [Bacteroidales bacterium]